MITHNKVRELFIYDEQSGDLIRKIVTSTKTKIGMKAGTLRPDGYRQISIDRKLYLIHRLVWFFHHGYWPVNTIDHINGNKADNRIENLREATLAQNACNRGKQTNNTSGTKGVCFHKERKSWRAFIVVNGKHKDIGYYKTKEEAIKARISCNHLHGEFARM